MKPSPRILHLLSILTLSPLGITPSYAELAANLQNGGFETGAPVAGAPFEQFQLDAWTVSGDAKAIEVTLQPTFVTTEGSRLAIFNGGGEQFGGRISQSFATVPGTLYRLRFDAGISVSPSWAPRAQRLAVEVSGTAEPVGSAQINLTGIEGVVQWSAQRLSFVAANTTTTLTFTDQSADLVSPSARFSDLLLDHVRVNANTAPVADDDSYAASADTPLTVAAAEGVLSDDADGEADPLTAVVVAGPSHGTLTLDPNGGFTYQPASGYIGLDSFSYQASDGELETGVATVTLTVREVPPAPVNGSFESGGLVLGAPFEKFQLDGWMVSGTPCAIAVTLQPDFSATNGSRLAIFNGGDDSFGGTISQTFATVPGTTYRLEFDAGITVSPSWAPRRQRLAVAVTGAGSLMTDELILTGTEGAAQWTARSYQFTANSLTTTLRFSDLSASLSSPSARLSDLLLDHVRLTPVSTNTAPLADDDSYLTQKDTPLEVLDPGVLAGDTDPELDALTAIRVSGPAHGSLQLNPAGGFTYLPASGFTGIDSFTYKASDNGLDSNVATVTITVEPVNRAPLALEQNLVTQQAVPLAISLTGNDPDGDGLMEFTVIEPPQNGTLTGTAPELTYTPAANFSGTDNFRFTVNDGMALSEAAAVSITVTPADDFSGWISSFELTADPLADPDGDSVSNALEYVMGGNPATGPNPDLMPTAALVTANLNGSPADVDYFRFTFRRTLAAANDPATTIRVEWSGSPVGPWIQAASTPGVVTRENAVEGAPDRVNVYLPRSLATDGRLFARLVVICGPTAVPK